MDTSKKYIKMCEKAEEIQDSHIKKPLDVFFHKSVIKTITSFPGSSSQDIILENKYDLNYKSDIRPKEWNDYCIWLPTQDQLQEIILKDRYCLHYQGRELIKDFYTFTHPEDMLEAMFINSKTNERISKECAYISAFTSMEQLWLAFVMKEKYNKIWNGEEWENV